MGLCREARIQQHVLSAAALFITCLTALAGNVQLIQSIGPAAAPSTGSGDSVAPVMSADGRFVVFSSTARNLAATTNSQPAAGYSKSFQVYLRDRLNPGISLLSLNRFGNAAGDGDSVAVGISTNGRYVLIESAATNLVTGDTNNFQDIFVRDRELNTNLLVSRAITGTTGKGIAKMATMTPDGRYVAFVSAVSNLVANDTNWITDVFVRDMETATTILVSSNALSGAGYGSDLPQISADGRYIAFYSMATNMLVGVTKRQQIYIHDRVAGETILASNGAADALYNATGESNAVCFNHVLSANGKYVAFAATGATNSVSSIILRYSVDTGETVVIHTNAPQGTRPLKGLHSLSITPDGRFVAFVGNVSTIWSNTPSVLVWDGNSQSIALASVNASGFSPHPQDGTPVANDVSLGSVGWPHLDATGRYVSFISTATDFVAGSAPGYHCYIRDLQSSNTAVVNVTGNGERFPITATVAPRVSEDATCVAFQSPDSTMVNGDFNQREDIFLRDLALQSTEVISAREPGLPDRSLNKHSTSASVSDDGRFIAFVTAADNLGFNDTNLHQDVFVRDLLLETTALVSSGIDGLPARGASMQPAISGNGRYVAFTSTATNIVPTDSNAVRDVFVRDLQMGAVVLGSATPSGSSGGNAGSYLPSISGDGRYLLFRSMATNLTVPPVTGAENVFLRDLQSSTTIPLTTGGAVEAVMTPDGRFIAFLGRISSTGGTNLYVWETATSQRVLTNAATGGIAISPDGAHVAYINSNLLYAFTRTTRSNVVVGAVSSATRVGTQFSADSSFLVYCSTTNQAIFDNNRGRDVYLYSLQTQSVRILSHPSNNLFRAASAASDSPTISFDGRFIAFQSAATDIVNGDTNGFVDIILHDRLIGTNTLISRSSGTSSGNNGSRLPIFSGNGHMLFFSSWASDFATDDLNDTGDVFAFAFPYAAITRLEGAPPAISWPATSGRYYRVEYKNTVDEPAWQTLNGPITITGNRATQVDLSPDAMQRIYRVVAF